VLNGLGNLSILTIKEFSA